MVKLAILIPMTPDRAEVITRLAAEIAKQVAELKAEDSVQVLIDQTPKWDMENPIAELTTGAKRNYLVKKAVDLGAEAIAFVDSDDMIGPTYIKRGLEFADSEFDCGELWGNIYWSGKIGKPFHHSIVHNDWWEDDLFYYRMPNHLNFQRLSKVKDIPFPAQSFGEDGQQSYAMRDAGVLKTMMPIPETLYLYFVGEPKHAL